MAIKKTVESPLYYFSRMDRQDKLTKFADSARIDPELLDKAKEINEKKGNPRNVVFIALAVTAWEWYGPNDNADSFFEETLGETVRPEDTLIFAYKTFEGKNLNRYHQQSGDNSGIGKIHYAHYNSDQHRVELVCEVYWDKAPAECVKLKRNVPLNVSMSCATEKDYCPCCGNAAATLDEHCDCVKYRIMDIIDGVPVEMINKPRYSELSIVIIPGDMNCRAMYAVQ